MKISMKSEYGVRALMDLAQHYGRGPLSTQVIATRHSIPQPFLDQVIASLRRAGLVRSIRGPLGGYALIREPGEIRLSEAVRALEGSLAPISCLDGPAACPMGTHCTLMPVWQQVQEATTRILEGITIGELADKEMVATPARYAI